MGASRLKVFLKKSRGEVEGITSKLSEASGEPGRGVRKYVQTYLDIVIRVLIFIDQCESGEKQDFIPYLLTKSKAELYSELLGVTWAFLKKKKKNV